MKDRSARGHSCRLRHWLRWLLGLMLLQDIKQYKYKSVVWAKETLAVSEYTERSELLFDTQQRCRDVPAPPAQEGYVVQIQMKMLWQQMRAW